MKSQLYCVLSTTKIALEHFGGFRPRPVPILENYQVPLLPNAPDNCHPQTYPHLILLARKVD